MTKNIIFCVSGVTLGFLLGFFIANSVSQNVASSTAATPSATRPDGPRPLGPGETTADLPPNHPDIGASSSEAGRVSAAERAAAEKADAAPQDFTAQFEAGKVFYDSHNYEKAAQYLERALALRPQDAAALTLMGNAKYDAQDYVSAATFYERSLAVKPDDPNVRTDFGLTFFLRRPPDPQRAIAEYRKSLAIDPKHEMTWQNLAAAAVYMKDKRTAIEALDKLASINPQNPALGSLRNDAEALDEDGTTRY
ncbi:MAG TPA: tetratricopeptide repeat protein [Pyrinomonadaceae bacterium]|nr:tetratricopeptide repeat protein [Pyrinomonadaceae bacterium]